MNAWLAKTKIKINTNDYSINEEGDDENDCYFCDNFCKQEEDYDSITLGDIYIEPIESIDNNIYKYKDYNN